MTLPPVDAVLLLSFGGPEGPDEVMPFLERVTRGRGVPLERLQEVARHYLEGFGGVSPLPEQCRRLRAALEAELVARGPDLPVYWGNRNGQPLLADTVATMAADGVRHAVVVTTSAFPSYSGCRQYREDLAGAAGPVVLTKLRTYWPEPGFLDPVRRNALRAAEGLTAPFLLFTAHSVPVSMARASGPRGGAYEQALREASARVAGDLPWDLAWQSRSGPPSVAWLEPDVADRLVSLASEGVREVVLVPVGFTSDHVEVVYDLDLVAVPGAPAGMTVRRAETVGTDPAFVAMLRDLVVERIAGPDRDDHGGVGTQDECPATCCLG
ncbi:MAG TPA: ferrochelatase [Mycobacteriales bacterium]|nr:ferrochelatase [Mycobacteriales bacterium]